MTDEVGHFLLCGLPAHEPLRVEAEAGGFASEIVEVRLMPGETREMELVVTFAAQETVQGAVADVTVWDRADLRGRVVGRVLDAETGEPVEGGLVAWGTGAYEEATSPQGAFVLDRVPAGEGMLRVQHLAYGEQQAAIAIPANATLAVKLRLAAEPIELEPITVTVTEVRDLTLEVRGFYERKEWGEKPGLGHFFTREDIERRNPHLISHMVADVPSVRLEGTHSYRSRTCRPYSARTPRNFCMWMNVYLDGIRVVEAVSPAEYVRNRPKYDNQLKLDELVNVSEVAAVEVYTSAASLPGRFGGATGQCGAVVAWSRTGQ